MVEIYIDKDYRLVSDTHGWVLQTKTIVGEKESKKGKQPKAENIGKEKWEDDGYFSSLRYLFTGYISKKARRSDAKSIQELIAVLDEAKDVIAKLPDVKENTKEAGKHI